MRYLARPTRRPLTRARACSAPDLTYSKNATTTKVSLKFSVEHSVQFSDKRLLFQRLRANKACAAGSGGVPRPPRAVWQTNRQPGAGAVARCHALTGCRAGVCTAAAQDLRLPEVAFSIEELKAKCVRTRRSLAPARSHARSARAVTYKHKRPRAHIIRACAWATRAEPGALHHTRFSAIVGAHVARCGRPVQMGAFLQSLVLQARRLEQRPRYRGRARCCMRARGGGNA